MDFTQQKRAVLLKAKALLDAAEKENRDLTVAERNEVDGYMREAKNFGEAAARWAKYPDLKDLNVGGAGGFSGAKGRSGDGSWSKAVREHMGAKAIMAPSGSVEAPSPTGMLAPLGDKVETLLQLIPQEPLTDSDGFSYLQETVRTQNAAVVAAAALKPTSVYTLERKEDRARVIAHLSEPIPRQWLSDAQGLRRYLDTVLREGLLLALESEIIDGDGTGEHFTGMLATSGINVQAWDTDILTTARKAQTTLELLSIAPGAYVFNPTDWETIELSVDLQGKYQMTVAPDARQSLPVDRARRRLWGLPVALSTGLTAGVGLLVDFAGSTALFEREKVAIDWSEATVVDGTSAFEKNLVVFRAEGRWGFAVTRPAGIVELDLGAGS